MWYFPRMNTAAKNADKNMLTLIQQTPTQHRPNGSHYGQQRPFWSPRIARLQRTLYEETSKLIHSATPSSVIISSYESISFYNAVMIIITVC